ncbi:MAG TPA: glycosyltransferase [Pyrinomonadaceae bacterium]|nr:glycosyltransferase [Pyrinomonadaceae bacterium]
MSSPAQPQGGDEGAAQRPRGVSVVVPSYNLARFIGATLRSIFHQTHAPTELLVIDDGSTDDSPRVVERTLRDCPFPSELVARGNRGLCATLNEGLSRSRSEYFAYLGADDLWLPDFLSARVAVLEARSRAVLAYGHAYLVDEEGRVVDCTKDWAVYADGDARGMLLETVAPMSPTVVYRREALARHGWNEESRLEDYELYLRLSLEGEFAFDPRPLAAWRRHGRNTSRDQHMMLEEQLKAQRSFLQDAGAGEAEIETLHRRIRFERAEDFLRLGDKAGALRLMLQNAGGAASARSLARKALRLLVPYGVERWRMQRRQRRAAARYGTINV